MDHESIGDAWTNGCHSLFGNENYPPVKHHDNHDDGAPDVVNNMPFKKTFANNDKATKRIISDPLNQFGFKRKRGYPQGWN